MLRNWMDTKGARKCTISWQCLGLGTFPGQVLHNAKAPKNTRGTSNYSWFWCRDEQVKAMCSTALETVCGCRLWPNTRRNSPLRARTKRAGLGSERQHPQPRRAAPLPPQQLPCPAGGAREAGAPARPCPAGRRGRAERSRAVSGRSAAALAGAPRARLSGCGRRGEGSGSGGTFPRRRAKLNSQRSTTVSLSPPGSEPSANAPRPTPPRPGRGAQRSAEPACPAEPGRRRCREGRALGSRCQRRRVPPSRPSERTTPAAWEEMSVAGKQPPPAPLERPASLLVPTWASTAAPRAVPAPAPAAGRGWGGSRRRCCPEGGREAPAWGTASGAVRVGLSARLSQGRGGGCRGSPGGTAAIPPLSRLSPAAGRDLSRFILTSIFSAPWQAAAWGSSFPGTALKHSVWNPAASLRW